ncbi:MAG: hypothetical protein JWO74_5007 [Solirubrobacterales bacterium]|nr:hypothetical protein [Solirubrobacterales bacterium]
MARIATPSSAEHPDGFRVPLLGIPIAKPDRGSLAWYAGLGLMGALDVIDWPVALVVGVSHALATQARNPEVREAAEGTEAAA